MLTEGLESTGNRCLAQDQRTDQREIMVKIIFKHGKEDLFFIFEIVVKRASRSARSRGDILYASVFKAFTGEDDPRCSQQLYACDERACLFLFLRGGTFFQDF